MSHCRYRFFCFNNFTIMLVRALIFLTILNLPGLTNILAQNKYQKVLSEAKKLLDNAYYDEVIDTLTQYLTNGFSNEEKKIAYRYLSHAYIAKDFLDKATDSITELLYLHYDYEPDPVEDGNQFIKLFKEFKDKLGPPRRVPLLFLEPIDFGTTRKGMKWSREFSKYLKHFFSYCDSIDLIMKADYQYQKVYPYNYFVLSGNCQKEDKIFMLDISLKEMHKLREVWRDTVTAKDQRGLADSVGVCVAELFGYQTNFVGIDIPIKPFAIASGISALASLILNNQAENEKTNYRKALTSKDATSSFNKLRAYEISRNSLGTLSSLFISPIIYTKLNPRRPILKKLRGNNVLFNISKL